MSYRKAFAEVYTILNCLDDEEYTKIPSEVLHAISTNMNEEYYYEIDDEVELTELQMLPETKAILFNLFRDYLSTPEQKGKIIRMQRDDRNKDEIKKQEMYNVDIFLNNKKKSVEVGENIQLVKYKQNFLQKIVNSIKKFFKF